MTGLARQSARAERVADVAPGPVDSDARLHALDILRGLALVGMILVHFHQRMRIEVTGLEDLIGWGVYILVEQKAWGTFAYLFGAGFAILLRRLDARGAPVATIYLRRLAALAVLGIIAEVGFGFQILFSYACWGIALLVVRRWSTRALLIAALVAVIARPVAAEATDAWVAWTGAAPAPASWRALRQAADLAAEEGSYGELLAARWAYFVGTTPGNWRGLLPDMNFALFVLGLLAVRHRVLDEPLRHRRLIAGWMAFGALSWLLAWIGFPGVTLGLVHDQWLCLAYIGAILLLLAARPAWTTRLTLVARAGRLALTNYMFQAVVLDVLGSAYGAGLKLRPLAYVVAAAVLFAAEAALATAWLAWYRFGPLEWLWRVVTYWRPQRLMR